MLKKRLCVRMDIRRDRLIQRRRYEGAMPICPALGRGIDYAKQGADELFINDCFASMYGRGAISEFIQDVTDNVMIPVTVAGGIRSEEDARERIQAGAERIAINTAAVKDKLLIRRLSRRFGSSAVVVQIDVKGGQLVCMGGRELVRRDLKTWVEMVVDLGAGELFVTNVSRDGMMLGLDNFLLDAIGDIPIPIMIGGGFNGLRKEEMSVFPRAAGIIVSSALHNKYVNVRSIKQAMADAGVPVRQEEYACWSL